MRSYCGGLTEKFRIEINNSDEANAIGAYQQNTTRRERLKSAPNLRLKSADFLWKKIEVFEFFFCQKKSQSAKKCKKGTLLDLLTYIPLQNIKKKLEGGTLWGQKKMGKKSHSVEKNTKGDPLVSSCFVSYNKNGLTERGDHLHGLKCAVSFLVVL